jgi:hypothetical protein
MACVLSRSPFGLEPIFVGLAVSAAIWSIGLAVSGVVWPARRAA